MEFGQPVIRNGYIAMHLHAMTKLFPPPPQYFSYALDVVFPRMLHRGIMDMFNVDSEEVRILIYLVVSRSQHF
jgi:hypothetical protein